MIVYSCGDSHSGNSIYNRGCDVNHLDICNQRTRCTSAINDRQGNRCSAASETQIFLGLIRSIAFHKISVAKELAVVAHKALFHLFHVPSVKANDEN